MRLVINRRPDLDLRFPASLLRVAVCGCGQGMRPPRRSDPTVEFHEQDNLALASLSSHSAADRDGNDPPLRPLADFVYDNSCYNNMRQAAVFPGALERCVGLLLHMLTA